MSEQPPASTSFCWWVVATDIESKPLLAAAEASAGQGFMDRFLAMGLTLTLETGGRGRVFNRLVTNLADPDTEGPVDPGLGTEARSMFPFPGHRVGWLRAEPGRGATEGLPWTWRLLPVVPKPWLQR